MEKFKDNPFLRAVVTNLGWLAALLAFFSIVWSIAYAIAGNDYLLPSFSETLISAAELLSSPVFWTAFFSTFLRAIEAFAVAFLWGVLLAFVSDMVPFFARFFAPIVSLMRSLPTLAVLLMILVWSTPAKAPVIVAFLALFPILYTAMRSALAAVSGELLEMSKVYRVPLRKKILCLYLPVVSPYLLRESAGALAFSLKLIVSAEVMANTYQSLGGLLQESKIYLDMPQMFALTIVVVSLGLILEGLGLLLTRMIERRTK